MLWYAIRQVGPTGWRRRAEQSRRLAEYTLNRLRRLGWPAWRNSHAFTVVIQTPPPQLAKRWMLADGGDGWSHIVCMPGVTYDRIDRFLTELAAEMTLPVGTPTDPIFSSPTDCSAA
jgi:histidine decarboxylase